MVSSDVRSARTTQLVARQSTVPPPETAITRLTLTVVENAPDALVFAVPIWLLHETRLEMHW